MEKLIRSQFALLCLRTIALVAALLLSRLGFAWELSVNFNGGVPETKAMAPNAYSGSSAAVFDATKSYEGGMSSRNWIKATTTAYGVFGGVINLPEPVKSGGEIWVRVRTYFPSGFNLSADPALKFLRIHTKSATETNGGYNDWYITSTRTDFPFYFTYEGMLAVDGVKRLHRFATFDALPQFDKWETWELYVRLGKVPSASGGTGLARMWKNGKLLKEVSEITLFSDDGFSNRVHIFTYWNGGSPADQHLWVDDIKITNDVPSGRDELGNPYIGVSEAPAQTPPSAPELLVE